MSEAIDWKETQLNLEVHDVAQLPTRFDVGSVRRAEITPEGFFRGEANYCRDGVLTYRSPNGTQRTELRLPEENQRALADFGLKPVTIEHPPVLLNGKNARNFAVGQSDSTTFYDPRSGFVRGVISVFDSDAIAKIQAGDKQEISIGYQCEIDPTPGVWKGQRYDAIQRNLKINHIALTQKGRAGADVRVLLDSEDVAYQVDSKIPLSIPTTNRRTMDLERNGRVFRDLPSDVVLFTLQEFEKLDSELEDLRNYSNDLETAARTDADSIENLSTELTETQSQFIQEKERADTLGEYLERSDSLLEELGLRRDSDGNYYQDSKIGKKKHHSIPEEFEEQMFESEDDEEDENDEEDEEEIVVAKKKIKKKKTDSLSDVLKAWKEADKIIPGLSDSDRFDSSLSATDVRRLVISQLRPERQLEGRSDAYIDGVYEGLTENLSSQPSQPDRTDSLDTFISLAAKNGGSQSSQTLNDRDKALSEAWRQPTALSRSN